MSDRLSDGTSVRASLESVERQTGKRPAELDGPELDHCLIPAWVAFGELHNRRSSNGFGLNPISWAEIEAWIGVEAAFGVPPSRWIIDAVCALDHAFLSYQADSERQKAKSKAKPKTGK